MRVVSLLPSITEIVVALGKKGTLVGRSHECNYPSDIISLPACTEPKFNPDGTSYQIDQRVKAVLQEGLAVYRVDAELLKQLNPDVILTQDHCDVCATSFTEVKEVVQSSLNDEVNVVSVSPTDLSSFVDSIRTIAQAIDAEDEAQKLTTEMKEQLQEIQQQTLPLYAPGVLCIEWLDPLMVAGNWIPELVQLAGGNPLIAEAGKHSPWLEWTQVQQADPDIITITPCGYGISETLSELSSLEERPGWKSLKAVQNHQVFIMDGDHYFNRPGPRLVDSTRILAEIIHPGRFRKTNAHPGWLNLHDHQFEQTID